MRTVNNRGKDETFKGDLLRVLVDKLNNSAVISTPKWSFGCRRESEYANRGNSIFVIAEIYQENEERIDDNQYAAGDR